MKLKLVIAGVLLLFLSAVASAQLMTLHAGSSGGSGGGTGNDLLANTGQPIYSAGTTPILVQ